MLQWQIWVIVQRPYDPQSQKFLLSGPSQEQFAWSRRAACIRQRASHMPDGAPCDYRETGQKGSLNGEGSVWPWYQKRPRRWKWGPAWESPLPALPKASSLGPGLLWPQRMARKFKSFSLPSEGKKLAPGSHSETRKTPGKRRAPDFPY